MDKKSFLGIIQEEIPNSKLKFQIKKIPVFLIIQNQIVDKIEYLEGTDLEEFMEMVDNVIPVLYKTYNFFYFRK